ncbi:T9SS type A sorting domain-containing protein [Polluticoccus soli]|uniref:T9SS type A sorting domain-containing protein n=1 Tax=Polluticoccus soli TaxID=3034150 RepID=UPI0023E199E8|nr:T9SS type A sorting domain-containing protein [Flavipsychrobacter sp. JY13-12]
MKNVYLFIALFAISTSASAKGEFQPIVTAGPVVNGKFPHFGNQVVNTATGGGGGSTPSKVSLRLIGRTHTKFSAGSFVPVDSYYYRYTDDRGGILANDNIDNDETLFYSESIYYKFDPTTAGFINQLRRMQDYYPNEKDKVQFLTYQQWNATKAEFRDSARYGYEYNGDGTMKQSTFQLNYANMWTNDVTSTISYLPNVTSMESQFYKAAFVYDASARLVETIDSQSSGNGIWQKNEKHTYEYSGKSVTKHFLYEWSNQQSSWLNKKNWQYGYNNDNDLIYKIEQEWNGVSWVNIAKHEYSYDGNHNMATDLLKKWDNSLGVYVDASREIWNYNIQNLPELITTSTWNGSSWIYTNSDQQYRLYYENFFPADVKQVVSVNELNIYPVPATYVVNVNLTLNSSEDILVSLYDMKGSTLYSASHHSATDLRIAIPVASLSTGTYFLRVVGSNTNVARSIVVQH